MKYVVFIVAALAACVVAQDHICSHGEEYVAHEDCTKYYQCDNGFAFEQECNDNLYWNPEVHTCDFPINVPECVGGTRPPIVPTSSAPVSTTTQATTTAPTTTAPTTNAPTTTVPTTAAPTTTPPTTQPTTSFTLPETPETEGTGVTSLPPGVCPPTGIVKIAHENRCDAYYLCVNGQRQEESHCAEGLFFDPAIQECNRAELVDCVSGTTLSPISSTPPTVGECPATGVVQIPYPGNCSMYIMCIQGQPILYQCPGGELFDVISAECKPEALAVCSEGKIVEIVQEKIIVEMQKPTTYWAYMKYLVSSFRTNKY